MPFFPRVLIHLVRLDDGVTQWVAVQPSPRVFLEAVPQLQQMLTVTAQLTGHPGRGLTRGDTVEDQQDLRGAAVCSLENGPGPGVEHAAALSARIVQEGRSVAVVDAQALLLTALGTGQPVGVE